MGYKENNILWAAKRAERRRKDLKEFAFIIGWLIVFLLVVSGAVWTFVYAMMGLMGCS